MDRKKAWSHYFTTGDETPLIKSYWKSIQYMAWDLYPYQQEDMFQVGLMGLMKALKRLDRDRVKSLDAWVFLNVRSMMFNARQFKPVESLDLMQLATEDELPSDMLDALPKREAFIIRLIHLENYKRTEIAQMMGITSARVGQLEQQGLDRLKDRYSSG